MFRVLGCITEQHDLRLVVLAALLCLFACATAMSMMARARASAAGRVRDGWTIAAGIVAGGGIWATHFVAMLAYEPGFPIAFDPGFTILSVVIAAVLCSVGFGISLKNGALGGAITGAAIGTMHYVGMAAVRAPADVVWDPLYVVASTVIGVGMMAIGMYLVMRQDAWRWYSIGAGIFTLAIVLLHFTGMAAFALVPNPTVAVPNAVMAPGTLAIAVASVAILIVALGLVGAVLDHHLALRASHEAERLRAHIVELEVTKHDLGAALRRADAANESKSAFLAAMSHELRTPLNAVLGFSELVLSECFGPIGSPRYKEYISDIRKSGSHLLSLINDVLDLSRLDAGQTTLLEEDVALDELLEEVRHMISEQAKKASVVLVTALHKNPLPPLRADPRRLRQIFLNLLSNAVKFTPAGGSVTISTREHQGALTVAIADTGIGIAASDIPKALERFGQVDSRLSRKYEGTGLGLPLAKQLVELHGGTLAIMSTVGAGTTVTVSFPAVRSQAPSAHEEAAAAA
jgi:signal transduction histidine kinase